MNAVGTIEDLSSTRYRVCKTLTLARSMIGAADARDIQLDYIQDGTTNTRAFVTETAALSTIEAELDFLILYSEPTEQ